MKFFGKWTPKRKALERPIMHPKKANETVVHSHSVQEEPAKQTKETVKPIAVAFVDFEHWYYSLKNNFSMVPDVWEWAQSIREEYTLKEVVFFGDFTKEIGREINKIRQITNQIIETKNGNEYYKKDYTDFIMLDAIYQKAIFAKEVETFILFTGDGHFNSVVAFLRNQLHKNVIVYGICNSVSQTLRAVASSTVEIPSNRMIFKQCYQYLLNTIFEIESRNTMFRPTFMHVVETTVDKTGMQQELLIGALRKLIDLQYIAQKTIRSEINKEIKMLIVDWEKVKKDRIWNEK